MNPNTKSLKELSDQYKDNKQAAEDANLQYVSNSKVGITRKVKGKGFSYSLTKIGCCKIL